MIPECNDVIKGTFFICGVDGEEFTDLSPELIEKYANYFRSYFIPIRIDENGSIHVID